ncbi:AraC family transcriptional regulator [Nocardia salmonicida]|uniref:AraC family transcriptional regulator n=1 Tax=Nocardia salmonicida TaxID=53431 RepID=UPI002E2AADFD|nr:AraC family transcriptional regulator [Nocardia salmonicida]
MPVVRSAALRAFRATIVELGGDPERYASDSGLPVRALDEDDLLVPELAVAATLQAAAVSLDCPDLGLRVAARTDVGMLGTLGLAMRNSATLGEALDCASRYVLVHSRSLRLSVVSDPYAAKGVVALRYGPIVQDPMFAQVTDLGLGCLHRLTQSLVEGGYGLRSVELAYPAPAPRLAYEQFFGAPVRDRRPSALLRLPAAVQARPVVGCSDIQVQQLALAVLAQQIPGSVTSTTRQARSAVLKLLGVTLPDAAVVADMLTMHRRTLQRRLEQEGTSLTSIIDDVRRVEARRYLCSTDLSLQRIAGMLSLSHQSALTRCSRRWWGVAPSVVRADARAAREGVA